MRAHSILVMSIAAGLCGCSTAGVPRIDLAGMTLPRWEMFRYGVRDPKVPTVPYTLTPIDLAEIKAQFSSEFRDGRTLEFGPVSARRTAAGSLVVCGLVNIRKPTGDRSGMSLFDGVGSFTGPEGRLVFVPQRLAGANAEAIDLYSDCRDSGVL